MKKSLLVIFSALMIASLALFTACNWESVATMKFTQQPATSYTVQAEGDPLDLLNFTVEVTAGSTTTTMEYQDYRSSIQVVGFDLSTVGTRTATVKYVHGSQELNLQFTYSVIESTSVFAGGTGSAAEPYLVSTPAQFQAMLDLGKNGNKKYYKLISDIDLGNTVVTIPHFYNDSALVGYSAYIDGNNYKLLNVNQGQTDQGVNGKYVELFGQVNDFTLKNIEITFAASGKGAIDGLIQTAIEGGSVTFENVVTRGVIDNSSLTSSNQGVFVSYGGRHRGQPGVAATPAAYVFKNCKNYTDLVNTNASFVAGFAVFRPSVPLDLSMDSCINYGTIEGAKNYSAGLVAVPGSAISNFVNGANTFKNCSNQGTVYSFTTGSSEGLALKAKNDAGYEALVAGIQVSGDKLISIPQGTIAYSQKVVASEGVEAQPAKLTFENVAADVAYIRVYYTGTLKYSETAGGNYNFYMDIKDDAFAQLKANNWVWDGVLQSQLVQCDQHGNNCGHIATDYSSAYVQKDEAGVLYLCDPTCWQIGTDGVGIKAVGFNAEGTPVWVSNSLSKVVK